MVWPGLYGPYAFFTQVHVHGCRMAGPGIKVTQHSKKQSGKSCLSGKYFWPKKQIIITQIQVMRLVKAKIQKHSFAYKHLHQQSLIMLVKCTT